MKKQLLLSLLLIGLFGITACYQDSDNTPESTSTTEVPDIIINTNIHGNFTSTDGQASDNYTIEINGDSYSINQAVYSIELENAKKKNQHISVSRDGNEIAYANVSLIENDNNKINILAFPEQQSTSLSPSTNSFNLNNSIKVQLSTPITNEININYNHIEDRKLLDQMGRWGTDEEGNDYFLNAHSAFYIESENLSLSKNPLELIIENSSSNQLSLFHLNEGFHQWILIDQVSESITLPNYGYYILANSLDAIFSEGQLSFEELPLAFQKLNLSLLNDASIDLISSSTGRWSSFLPLDIVSKLSISDPCDNLVYQEELIIDENSTSFNSTLISEDSENLTTIKFKELNCSGEASKKPGAFINFGASDELMIFLNEEVEIALLSCGEFTISGYDVENNFEGIKIPWDTNIEDQLDYLSVCQDYINGFSFLKINGEMEILPAFKIEKIDNKTIFSSEDENIQIIIRGEGVGSYPEDQVNFYMNDINFGANGYLMPCQNTLVGCGFDDCYISHFQEMSNGLTRITFSGNPWMQTIENPTAGYYTVEGQIITKL